MSLRRWFGLSAFALLSCGGRSGLHDFAESNGGAAPTLADGGTTSTNDGNPTAIGDSPSGAGVGGSGGNPSNAGASSRGGTGGRAGADSIGDSPAIGPWSTLSHEDPPAPHENAFDFAGFSTTFTDVWSDDPSRALIAATTPGYKAPPSAAIMRYENGAMRAFNAGTEHLYQPPRFSGLSLSDLWLAEDYNGLEHSDGNAWTSHAQPQAQLVWENAANDVWACSSMSSTNTQKSYQLSRWNGSSWTQFQLPTLEGFAPTALWSRSPSDTFVAGTLGTLLHWNGTTFEVHSCPGVGTWSAVWGAHDAIWTVGDGGAIARWQGDTCTLLPTQELLGGVRALSDIWGSGADNLWIVGERGSILRWRGATLELEPAGVAEDLYAVWGNPSGVVWAVGANQTLLRRVY